MAELQLDLPYMNHSSYNLLATVQFLCLFDYNGYQIKENEIGGACSTDWRDEKCIKYFVGKSEEKRSLGRPRRRWEVNIRMHLRETGW
jgi:hypothetical protein